MSEIADKEILKVMQDGGIQLCDSAIKKWSSDEYQLPYDVTQANINRWKTIKNKIPKLFAKLKG